MLPTIRTRRGRRAEPLRARRSPRPEAPKSCASQLRPELRAGQGAAGTRAPGAGHAPLAAAPSRGDKVTPRARTRRDSPRGPPGPAAPSAPLGRGTSAGGAARGARGRPPGLGAGPRAPRASPCGRPRARSAEAAAGGAGPTAPRGPAPARPPPAASQPVIGATLAPLRGSGKGTGLPGLGDKARKRSGTHRELRAPGSRASDAGLCPGLGAGGGG